MDGVLINSAPSAQRVRTRLLAEYGIDFNKLPDPHGEEHKGSSMRELLKVVSSYHPSVAIDEKKFAKDQTESGLEDLQNNGIAADPKLIVFLDELKVHSIPCAVATAGMQVAVDHKLRILGIRKYFQVVITADDVKEHKPSPACYLLAAEKLGVQPTTCVIFEDSTPGVEAGFAAGSTVIGFTKYTKSKNKFAHTQETIDDWSQINYDRLVRISDRQL